MVVLCPAATPIVPSLLDKKRRRAARLGLPRPRLPLGVQVWEPVDGHAAGDQTKQVPRRPHPWNNSRRPPAVRCWSVEFVRACVQHQPECACTTSDLRLRAHMLCDRFCMGGLSRRSDGMGGTHGIIKTWLILLSACAWIYDAKNFEGWRRGHQWGAISRHSRILRRSKLASHSTTHSGMPNRHSTACCSHILGSGRELLPGESVGQGSTASLASALRLCFDRATAQEADDVRVLSGETQGYVFFLSYLVLPRGDPCMVCSVYEDRCQIYHNASTQATKDIN